MPTSPSKALDPKIEAEIRASWPQKDPLRRRKIAALEDERDRYRNALQTITHDAVQTLALARTIAREALDDAGRRVIGGEGTPHSE